MCSIYQVRFKVYTCHPDYQRKRTYGVPHLVTATSNADETSPKSVPLKLPRRGSNVLNEPTASLEGTYCGSSYFKIRYEREIVDLDQSFEFTFEKGVVYDRHTQLYVKIELWQKEGDVNDEIATAAIDPEGLKGMERAEKVTVSLFDLDELRDESPRIHDYQEIMFSGRTLSRCAYLVSVVDLDSASTVPKFVEWMDHNNLLIPAELRDVPAPAAFNHMKHQIMTTAMLESMEHRYRWDICRQQLQCIKHIAYTYSDTEGHSRLHRMMHAKQSAFLHRYNHHLPTILVESTDKAPSITPDSEELVDHDLHRLMTYRASLEALNTPDEAKTSSNPESMPYHLVVFVHGLAGSKYDFRLYRNLMECAPRPFAPNSHLNNALPHSYLFSDANSKNSYGDLLVMGVLLAEEIREHIAKVSPDQFSSFYSSGKTRANVQRITIIAHSQGGLVARAALKHLIEFKEAFDTFITFSTPHLGVRYLDHGLLMPGILWAANMVGYSKALDQLMLKDEDLNAVKTSLDRVEDARRGSAEQATTASPHQVQQLPENKLCLMKLAESAFELDWFRNIILISSPDDHYVPFHSCRMEMDPGAVYDDQYGPIYIRMLENLRKIERKIQRLSIGFNGDSRGANPISCPGTEVRKSRRGDRWIDFDKWLGRRAHIDMLENVELINAVLAFNSWHA